jgi:hypothetical protein
MRDQLDQLPHAANFRLLVPLALAASGDDARFIVIERHLLEALLEDYLRQQEELCGLRTRLASKFGN